MRDQKHHETQQAATMNDSNKKKRRASDHDDQGVDTIQKRAKASKQSLPNGFFDPEQESTEEEAVDKTLETHAPANEVQMKIPSRPATPLKTIQEMPKRPSTNKNVDEDEWAAFEADIAASGSAPELEVKSYAQRVISAPAMTTADLRRRDAEEDYNRRKERLEAEAEGDKEDAARKLEDEFEEMESLEERVKKLREKREALRRKEGTLLSTAPQELIVMEANALEDDEDEEEEEDDDWDGFRMRS